MKTKKPQAKFSCFKRQNLPITEANLVFKRTNKLCCDLKIYTFYFFFKVKEKHFTLIGWENNAFRMLPFAYASIRNRIVFLHISLKSTKRYKRYNVWKIYSNTNNINNFYNGSALHKEILNLNFKVNKKFKIHWGNHSTICSMDATPTLLCTYFNALFFYSQPIVFCFTCGRNVHYICA